MTRRELFRWAWVVLFGVYLGYVTKEAVENFPREVVEVSS